MHIQPCPYTSHHGPTRFTRSHRHANQRFSSLPPSQPPEHRMSCSPSTSIVYPHPSLHNPPSRRHSDRPIRISCLLRRSCGRCPPTTHAVNPHFASAPPLPRASPASHEQGHRSLPALQASSRTARVVARHVYTSPVVCRTRCSNRGACAAEGRRFEAKPARRCPSGLLMMRGRGWNHSTMMRNVLDITRASLSLVHDACASVLRSSSNGGGTCVEIARV